MEDTSEAMHRGGFNHIYVKYFLDDFRRSWKRKARAHPERWPRRGIRGIHSVRAFDDRWTAPSFGWKDAADYYRDASPLRVLDRIAVSGTVLHAADDPFVPLGPQVAQILRQHPSLDLLETTHGGHNAFFSPRPALVNGWQDLDRYWGENRMAQDFALAARAAGALS